MIKEIKFTDNALKQIQNLLSKKDEGSFFRIAIKGGGCSGFQYEFTFEQSKNEDDLTFKNILIDKTSADLLKDSEVDYVSELMGESFKISNPQTKSSCGCGVSFSLVKVASDALKVPSYLLLVFGFYVCGFHLAFITVHMPVYLADIGFSASVGAVSISVIGLFNIFGAYYAGIFSDRAQMSRILVIIYVARAIVISLFLILPKSIVSVLVFSALIGLLWLATVPPTSGLVAKFFGTRYMTYLYGIVFFSHQVGSFTGVWLGGELYQRFGNYDGVWIAGILLGFMAALLHFYIDEQSYEYKISTTIS